MTNEEAIIILESIQPSFGGKHTFSESKRCVAIEMAISALVKQSEIIRCEDCKHLQKWRSEESAKKFGQIYECARNVLNCPKSEDFCSRAERREDE